jgi:hypothetical protein
MPDIIGVVAGWALFTFFLLLVLDRRFRGVTLSGLFHKVPKSAWIVLGVTIYFTLGHIYASWMLYAHAHPGSWAEAILGPWPVGLPTAPKDYAAWIAIRILGPLFFLVSWGVTTICYAAWIVFGGGIAELLHLTPR